MAKQLKNNNVHLKNFQQDFLLHVQLTLKKTKINLIDKISKNQSI